MEKPSAAHAVDWNNALEKGIRSKKPGQNLKSIQLTGKRIEKWSQEPKLKLTVYDLFGMIHGQERLFADSILVRLADAFASGDRDTKIQVVNGFLSEMRNRNRKRQQTYGIFSKMSSDKRIEILRRIKKTPGDGNIESKELTIVLYGCWSEIAQDLPEIQYEILSGLVSPHTSVVKASLFAAGCFAELSYDFACVFLRMLIRIMASPKIFSTVKIAAAWTFRKLGHFYILKNKAYKEGSEIVLNSSEDIWLATMLISLSKLASKSISLSSEQVNLLCGLLAHNVATNMQLTILRSLRYLFKTSHITTGEVLLEKLLKILNDNNVPSPLRYEALQLFSTIALHVPCDMLSRMLWFNELVTLVVNTAKSPDTTYPERVLASQALVGLFKRMKGRKIIDDSDFKLLSLFCDAASSIGRETVLHTKQMSGNCEVSDVELQFKSLLQLLFILIDSTLEVSLLLLDSMCSIFEALADICHKNIISTELASAAHEVIWVRENDTSFFASKIIHYIYKNLFGFIQSLHATEATSELLYKLKHIVSFACQCYSFNCSTHVKFSLLLPPCGRFSCCPSENGKEGERTCPCGTSLLEDGTLNRECIGNMLTENDDWESYLVGKHAACRGAWIVCDPVFKHLQARVQSQTSSSWLMCLSQFANSEKCIQGFFYQEPGSVSMDTSVVLSQLDAFQQHILASDSTAVLICAKKALLSSERLLGRTTLLKQTFCFQRWFLSLRAKVLEVVTDLLKLLAKVLCNQDAMQTEGVNETDCSLHTQEGDNILHLLAGLSMKSLKIAREYDLMNSSFFDMDHKSFRVLSSVALSCSLLAFCIGLAYFTPNSPILGNSCTSKDSGDCLHATLVEDLVGRLSHVDPETSMNIISVFKGDDAHEASLRAHCKSRSNNIVYEAGNTVRVCSTTVKRIRSVHNEMVGARDECSLPVLKNKRARLLLDIIKEWMNIPFCTPKFFFKVRRCISAVLYSSSSSDDENSTDISVMSGSHLSLSLCLQLKNVPPAMLSRITKVFCILQCKKSLVTPHVRPYETKFVDYEYWNTDSMMRLHEKLQWRVIEQAGENLTGIANDAHISAGSGTEAYVSFEMNGRIQGYNSCLLDVRSFPVGLYRIDWHSCFIDESGSYWSLHPSSPGPLFTVRSSNP